MATEAAAKYFESTHLDMSEVENGTGSTDIVDIIIGYGRNNVDGQGTKRKSDVTAASLDTDERLLTDEDISEPVIDDAPASVTGEAVIITDETREPVLGRARGNYFTYFISLVVKHG